MNPDQYEKLIQIDARIREMQNDLLYIELMLSAIIISGLLYVIAEVFM